MQYEYEPSDEQRSIIEEPRLDIPLKVVAGAGSGKTFVLAHRFAWLVTSGEVSAPERILTLTFTNNAAAEMKMRIKRLLRLNGAAATGDLWVQTFHSFAARLLRECAYLAGLPPEAELLTEVSQHVELHRLVDGIFAGDFAQLKALEPSRLVDLGFSRPEGLREALIELVKRAKSYGRGPSEFRRQARDLTQQFWAAMPTVEEIAELEDASQLAPELQRCLAGVADAADLARAPVDVGDATRELRRLYYSDLKKVLRPDLHQRLRREQQVERDIVGAGAAAYELYQQRLAQADTIDFDDQIMMASDLLAKWPKIRDRYRDRFEYILVDEFQDTSPAQMAMLQTLAQPVRLPVTGAQGVREVESYSRLMVVGDQKQSIYGWRYARPENLDRLLPFGPGDKVDGSKLFRPLTVTYRMEQRLTECANQAAQRTRPEDPSLVTSKPDPGTVIRVTPFAARAGESMRHTRRREAAYIAENIQQLVCRQEQFGYGDICVLMRTRHAFRYLKNAFEERKVPYQALGGVGFFDHPLACDLLALMRVVHDPFDDASLVRLLARPPLSLNDRQLFLLVSMPTEESGAPRARLRPKDRAIMTALGELAEDRDEWRTPAERDELPADRLGELYELVRRLREASLLHPARTVFEMMLESLPDSGMTAAERAAAPAVKATFEAIIEELGTEDRGANLAAVVRAVDLYQADSSLELPAPDLPVHDAVQVMTIHRAKGLGFPAVFVMGWDPTGLARRSAIYNDTWGLVGFKVDGESSAKKIVQKLFTGNEEEMREEERLWYVALTRAERLLCVTYAAGTRKNAQIPWGDDLVGAVEEPGGELAEHITLGPGYGQAASLLPARLPEEIQLAQPPGVIRTSFSALRDILVCPRRWWISRQWHGDELVEEAGPAVELAIGTCFHQYAAAYYRSRGVLDDNYVRSLSDSIPADADPDDLARFHKLIEAFLASSWAQLAPPSEDVERSVHLVREVGELIVAVSGRADLVLAERGQFADFKTNRRLGDAQLEDYALQMLIYQQALAAESSTGSSWQPLLVHVTPSGLRDVALGEALLARQAPRLDQALIKLVELEESQQWPEMPPAAPCESCEYAALCGQPHASKQPAADGEV